MAQGSLNSKILLCNSGKLEYLGFEVMSTIAASTIVQGVLQVAERVIAGMVWGHKQTGMGRCIHTRSGSAISFSATDNGLRID